MSWLTEMIANHEFDTREPLVECAVCGSLHCRDWEEACGIKSDDSINFCCWGCRDRWKEENWEVLEC